LSVSSRSRRQVRCGKSSEENASMRILHTVEFYHPSTGGAQEVVRQISERLAKRGHDVTVATTRLPNRANTVLNGVHIESFAVSGNAASGCVGETERYREFLLAGKFDIMMNYAAQQWATHLVSPVLSQISCRKVMAPCGFSALFMQEYATYFQALPAILGKYDHLIFHSRAGRDVEFARRHRIENYSLIPNGASLDEFAEPKSDFRDRYKIPRGQPLLLTVGSHTGAKGHSVVMEAFRRARIGHATLVIIGNTLGNAGCLPRCKLQAQFVQLASFGKKRVLLFDPPRADVVAAYHAADLFVFGSNIECSPIVLFEAAASKTPFLSTACGNAAEIAEWTGAGIILSSKHRNDGWVYTDAGIMARAIEEILGDQAKLSALRQAGYEAWRNRFSWEKIALEYEQLYIRLCKS
jgi:glycosyltransferase involved in cell wall biosynthesis